MTTALQPTAGRAAIDLATPNGKKLPMAAFVEKYVQGEIQVSGICRPSSGGRRRCSITDSPWEQMKVPGRRVSSPRC
jgi:hypothetical protein